MGVCATDLKRPNVVNQPPTMQRPQPVRPVQPENDVVPKMATAPVFINRQPFGPNHVENNEALIESKVKAAHPEPIHENLVGAYAVGSQTSKQYHINVINPIDEVPSSAERDSRNIIHNSSQNIVKAEDNYKFTFQIPSKTHLNDPIITELGQVNQLLQKHAAKQSEDRKKLKENRQRVYGQQQVLQTYYQQFEIPLFEVTLAGHSQFPQLPQLPQL